MTINTVPPGQIVVFSRHAVPCNHIYRIERAEDGVGIRVRGDGFDFVDPKTTFKDACDGWSAAMQVTLGARND